MMVQGDGGSGWKWSKLFENETVQAFVQEMVLDDDASNERY
jgi:hypothetical protein